MLLRFRDRIVHLTFGLLACAVCDGIISSMRAIPTVLGTLLFGIISPSTAIGQQFMLVCHVVPAPSLAVAPFDTNLLVDVDTSSVNGSYASIRDDVILWEGTTKKGTSFSLRINRLTGTMTATGRQAGEILWTGHCEKAR